MGVPYYVEIDKLAALRLYDTLSTILFYGYVRKLKVIIILKI